MISSVPAEIRKEVLLNTSLGNYRCTVRLILVPNSYIWTITNAPWYVTVQTLHNDLNVPFIKDTIREQRIKHYDKQGHHNNTILQPLLEQQQQRRRLRKLWPADLRMILV
jgi:hypothetical protein